MYGELRNWTEPFPRYAGTSASRLRAQGPQLDRPDPKQNRLLASLPEEGYREILAELEGVSLPLGLALREPGALQRHVYFPTSGIVAIVYGLESGALTEFALTGNEGMVGTPLILGSETATSRAVVAGAGYAYRLSASVLKKLFERDVQTQQLLLRYIHALIAQTAQTAVCNRHHAVEQQLCRWLLLSLDRMPSEELTITHDLVATMLGVRRESVSEAVSRLQAREVLQCRRGHITVRDRAKLEACACECYAVVKREYDRLIPAKLAARASAPASTRTPSRARFQSPTLSSRRIYG
jgi:CRP-like cAMP-binding protein